MRLMGRPLNAQHRPNVLRSFSRGRTKDGGVVLNAIGQPTRSNTCESNQPNATTLLRTKFRA